MNILPLFKSFYSAGNKNTIDEQVTQCCTQRLRLNPQVKYKIKNLAKITKAFCENPLALWNPQ